MSKGLAILMVLLGFSRSHSMSSEERPYCSGVGIVYQGDINKPVFPILIGASMQCVSSISLSLATESDREWAHRHVVGSRSAGTIVSRMRGEATSLDARRSSRRISPALSLVLVDHGQAMTKDYDLREATALLRTLASSTTDENVRADVKRFTVQINALKSRD